MPSDWSIHSIKLPELCTHRKRCHCSSLNQYSLKENIMEDLELYERAKKKSRNSNWFLYPSICLSCSQYIAYHYQSYRIPWILLVQVATHWMGYWSVIPWYRSICFIHRIICKRTDDTKRNGKRIFKKMNLVLPYLIL